MTPSDRRREIEALAGPHDGAVISDCSKFRWRLDRAVGSGSVCAAVFGINPSTADHTIDDATVRKWKGFALRLGWSRFIVGNVFSYRATDVSELARHTDLFGSDHHIHIESMLKEADILVPCWGDRGKVPKSVRYAIDDMLTRILNSGKPVFCWGKTSSGDPKHPLMLGYDTPLEAMWGKCR